MHALVEDGARHEAKAANTCCADPCELFQVPAVRSTAFGCAEWERQLMNTAPAARNSRSDCAETSLKAELMLQKGRCKTRRQCLHEEEAWYSWDRGLSFMRDGTVNRGTGDYHWEREGLSLGGGGGGCRDILECPQRGAHPLVPCLRAQGLGPRA